MSTFSPLGRGLGEMDGVRRPVDEGDGASASGLKAGFAGFGRGGEID